MQLNCKNRSRLLVAAALICALASVPLLSKSARAADLGGDCCADLEERVAELEATTVRKGNKKVSVTLYGQVNRAALFWDDGAEKNAYVVDNNYESSALASRAVPRRELATGSQAIGSRSSRPKQTRQSLISSTTTTPTTAPGLSMSATASFI
jgi:hypothetical protein